MISAIQPLLLVVCVAAALRGDTGTTISDSGTPAQASGITLAATADQTSGSARADTTKIKIYVVPIQGTIEPGMAAFLGRAFRDINPTDNTLIIIEMDSFGGRVDAAFQMVDTLLNATGNLVAYVKTKAISAGAMIALACDNLVMRTGTTLGDCEPIIQTQEGPQSVGEKIQSPLRAKFRTMARQNGYPIALSEAMVSKDHVVYRITTEDTVLYLDSLTYAELPEQKKNEVISRKTIVARGKLLTMDDVEAHRFGFSSMSVESIPDMLEKMDITDYELVRIEENWSENFVRYLSKIAPLLMLVGMAALYLEIRTPGFGVPGIIGIISLSLVFFGQHAVGLADYSELLLIVLGIVLLAMEVFVIPGFGIAGIAGLACIAIGMILSLQDFVIPRPDMPWQAELLLKNTALVFASLIGSFLLVFLVLRYAFPRVSKFVSGPYLEATLSQAHADSQSSAGVAIGDSGTVKTALRPCGKVKIGKKVVDAVAEGDFIETDTEVTVIQATRNKIVVSRKARE
ncbi:MAG: serine protease [Chitinivibrionales bacterium]|nr:serine protease [Chitinivibrionales bacterium]